MGPSFPPPSSSAPWPSRIRGWGAAALCILGLSAPPVSAAFHLVLDGNDFLGRKDIESVIGPPENPGEMTPEDWEDWGEEAAQALADLYRESGFFDAEVAIEADTARPEGKQEGPRVTVQVREGPHYRFGRVALLTSDQSRPLLDSSDLKSRTGKLFDKDLIFRDRRTLLNGYGDAGFIHARTSEKVLPDTVGKIVNLEFTVEPGHAVVFDTLIIRNLREGDSLGTVGVTSTRLLKALMNLEKGDTVSLSGMGKFERKLKSTRVFNYVRLKDSLLEDQGYRSALILSTEERIPGEMDVSLFYETQYLAGMAVNWSHGNIQGLLHEGRLGGSLAQKRQSAYLGYASPLLFGTSIRFDNDLVANWYQDTELQKRRGPYHGDFDITNSSRLSRSLASWSRYVGTTELLGKSERTGKPDSIHLLRDFNLNFINSTYFSFLDVAATPNRGVRWSFIWGNGGSFLSQGTLQVPATRRHNWLEGESGFYWPMTERLKLAFRLDGGRFFGQGGINSERFYLGGPRSVRSFGWRQICPEKVDAESDICVKEGIEPAYYLTSFEIRANPFSWAPINSEGFTRHLLGLQVVPFVDYGYVWEVGKPLTPEGEGKAFGLGLRYSLLSIFNLRLDYALDRFSRNRHSQWVLDLAQAF